MAPNDDNNRELKASFGQIAHMHKGDEVSLNQLDPGLHRVIVGLGWDAPPEHEGFVVDIDASAFILNRDGRVRQDTDFVFYNNLTTENGALNHLGDNTSGSAEGDDERIEVKIEEMGYDVEKSPSPSASTTRKSASRTSA